MATITLTFTDTPDENGEVGLTVTPEGLEEAGKDLEENGTTSVALLVALTFYRMMEKELIQRQLDVWCAQEMGAMKMAEMKRQALKDNALLENTPANDS
jgi:hypothetical protein